MTDSDQSAPKQSPTFTADCRACGHRIVIDLPPASHATTPAIRAYCGECGTTNHCTR